MNFIHYFQRPQSANFRPRRNVAVKYEDKNKVVMKSKSVESQTMDEDYSSSFESSDTEVKSAEFVLKYYIERILFCNYVYNIQYAEPVIDITVQILCCLKGGKLFTKSSNNYEYRVNKMIFFRFQTKKKMNQIGKRHRVH